MTKSIISENSSYWHALDPDPGTFTQLCSKIGAQGIQVEQLSLHKDKFYNFEPIFGIFLLAKQNSRRLTLKEDGNNSSINNYPIYFLQQTTTHNAYAMHALLHILLNSDNEIKTSKDLRQFKKLTHALDSTVSLINNQALRNANNSLYLPKKSQQKQIVYHSISYIKYNGYLWELDTFKKSPSKLVACNEYNWLDSVYNLIYQKQKEDSISLWAVIEDRNRVYQRKIIEKNYLKRQIEYKLDKYQPNWKSSNEVTQWEEEYRYAIDHNETNRRGHIRSIDMLNYCHSFNQLPLRIQKNVNLLLKEQKHNVEDIMEAWIRVQDDCLRLYASLGNQVEKEDIYRRKQNKYIPFIRAFIQALYEEGHLQSIITNL
ncbi:ubiquitin carboxyl-terminal hydrolase [Cokeromyces recurvatus]|uniref:ubiquitin carboxyl-terminal hydrolase n=1 Tax=Cokeromyces recurvatus TaxID=90255 RepID=UPI00221F3904|nr:ubiquitin carboxyl-terminal hydrolase [Cokeromyces recurvatus]KAI7904238.1 ubiquitin carboxyl-terminal hydrolase [Cokeromyces recurvatus]